MGRYTHEDYQRLGQLIAASRWYEVKVILRGMLDEQEQLLKSIYDQIQELLISIDDLKAVLSNEHDN